MRRRLVSAPLALALLLGVGGVALAPPAAATWDTCNATRVVTSTSTYAHRSSCTNVQARIDRYGSTLYIYDGPKGSSSKVESSVGVNAGNYYKKWQATSESPWLVA